MDETEDPIQAVQDDVEDYSQTVHALLAFGALITYDGGRPRSESGFGFGRRMTTSEKNQILKADDLTPDLVAQKSAKYGIVSEAKKSLPRDEARWRRYGRHLRKYDDSLTGWWTDDEKIPHSDTVMLVHQSRGRQFGRFLEGLRGNDANTVGPTTSVVEFNRADEASPYLFFRREFGPINDPDLRARLDAGVSVPLEKVQESYPTVYYYDARPPVSLLLTHLWLNIFPSYLASGDYDASLRATRIEVSLKAITSELQQGYGSGQLVSDKRACEFPKFVWVREAFARLVRFKLAIGPQKDADAYTVLFRRFRGDVLKRFIRLGVPLAKEPTVTEGEQMRLFERHGDD
jgi:hypothetical protein